MIAELINSVVRGWMNYFGRYNRSAMRKTLAVVQRRLIKWAMCKYKHFRGHRRRAEGWLKEPYKEESPTCLHIGPSADEILVIDNPLVVGDRVFREKMIKTLEAFAHDKDVTIIIVTNDIVLAKRLCTRAVVLEKGKIEFDGSPEAAIMYYRRNFRNDIKESVRSENDSFSQNGDDTDDDYDLEF